MHQLHYFELWMCDKISTHVARRAVRLLGLPVVDAALTDGNGQPRVPALCQLYRLTFVPYSAWLAW